MIFLIITSVLLLVVLTYLCYKYYTIDQYLKNVRGPKPLPILETTLEFRKPFLDMLNNCFQQYGDTFKCQIIFSPVNVITRDINLIQFVLSSPKFIEKGFAYKFLRSWLGNGLITSTNPIWKRHRKLITPSFHFKILECFLAMFFPFESSLVAVLQKEVGKKTVDIFPIISVHTLNLICTSSMGSTINADKFLFKNINELCRITMERVLSPAKSIDLLFSLTTDCKIQKQALSNIHKHTDLIISSRRKEVQNTNDLINLMVNEIGLKKKLSFLDTLLIPQTEANTLTDKEIRDEVITFMVAGYETTASTISYVLYSLAQHPDVQEKVVEELKCIYSNDKNKQTTSDDLFNMKYLEMVIKETLRLYPAAPFITRTISENVTFGNITFPKGINLGISIFDLHRDPKFYENPEHFDPERFTLENIMKRPSYAYIPFSGGMRNCIGQKYAIVETKSVLSTILRNFEILPSLTDNGLHLRADVALRSTNGINIRLKKRDF